MNCKRISPKGLLILVTNKKLMINLRKEKKRTTILKNINNNNINNNNKISQSSCNKMQGPWSIMACFPATLMATQCSPTISTLHFSISKRSSWRKSSSSSQWTKFSNKNFLYKSRNHTGPITNKSHNRFTKEWANTKMNRTNLQKFETRKKITKTAEVAGKAKVTSPKPSKSNQATNYPQRWKRYSKW